MLDTLKRPGQGGRLALLASLVVVAGCEKDPAPPFVVEGVGALEGVVFYDADRNGAFDPSAGDSAVAGARLVVRERGTDQTLSGGEATSDVGGRFSVASLPAGTHDLFLDTTSVAAGVAFCQNPSPVTIAIDLVRFAPVAGREGCVIAIADAEALTEGEFVTIQGLVTAAPGQIRSEATYLEDASGGTQVFDGTFLNLGIEVGDRIEISGTLSSFAGEFEIVGAQLNAIDKAFAVPVPATVTTAEIAAAGAPPTAPLQGRFLMVLKAQQTTAFTGGGGRNASFDDGSGAMEVRIEVGVIANAGDVATQFPPGKCYDITGALGSFNAVAQLKPRTVADMKEVPCT